VGNNVTFFNSPFEECEGSHLGGSQNFFQTQQSLALHTMSPIALSAVNEAPDRVMDHKPEPLCAIVTPMGMLGYGFDEQLLHDKLNELTKSDTRLPIAIVMDSGSTDSGPSKLALGSMTCPEASYRRDLTSLIRASTTYKVPILLSSAGGDGSNEHVDLFVEMIREIGTQLRWSVSSPGSSWEEFL
jgi:hypothetical protein